MKVVSTIKYLELVACALACFVVLHQARAVVPAPDGGYPGRNTAEGDEALFNLTTGADNTAAGFGALFRNTTGSDNTAVGSQALFSNSFSLAFPSDRNTAIGSQALFSNRYGLQNTATGFQALHNNTIGSSNTASGSYALRNSTTGHDNTAIGGSTLFRNTSGNDNTAIGYLALFSNTTGLENTATGDALLNNTTGKENAAIGGAALSQSNGSWNCALGFEALENNTAGDGNTAVGRNALFDNSRGSNNIAVGDDAGRSLTNGNDNIHIGNPGFAGDSGHIRIGIGGAQTATFIASIQGATVANGVPVVVSGNGQLGTVTSSLRFKEAVKPMGEASEAILGLKPVTFRYKQDIDAAGIPQFGLIAEQVEKVNPDLVVRDENGEVTTVRDEAVNAMLLNEFLKEHSKNEQQEVTIERLERQLRR
jgi:Chaperone of endosialidase